MVDASHHDTINSLPASGIGCLLNRVIAIDLCRISFSKNSCFKVRGIYACLTRLYNMDTF